MVPQGSKPLKAKDGVTVNILQKFIWPALLPAVGPPGWPFPWLHTHTHTHITWPELLPAVGRYPWLHTHTRSHTHTHTTRTNTLPGQCFCQLLVLKTGGFLDYTHTLYLESATASCARLAVFLATHTLSLSYTHTHKQTLPCKSFCQLLVLQAGSFLGRGLDGILFSYLA